MALNLRDRRLYREDEKANHRLLNDDQRQRLLDVRFSSSLLPSLPTCEARVIICLCRGLLT